MATRNTPSRFETNLPFSFSEKKSECEVDGDVGEGVGRGSALRSEGEDELMMVGETTVIGKVFLGTEDLLDGEKEENGVGDNADIKFSAMVKMSNHEGDPGGSNNSNLKRNSIEDSLESMGVDHVVL